jgi:hypothetical protein
MLFSRSISPKTAEVILFLNAHCDFGESIVSFSNCDRPFYLAAGGAEPGTAPLNLQLRQPFHTEPHGQDDGHDAENENGAK